MAPDFGIIAKGTDHGSGSWSLPSKPLPTRDARPTVPQPQDDSITSSPVRRSGEQHGKIDMMQEGPAIDDNDTAAAGAQSPSLPISKMRAVTVIANLAGINFLNTMGSGILIAALPRIAQDTNLSHSLILWPAAVYALAAGCLLLMFGAVADVIGPKIMWVTGSFLYAAFTVGAGLSQTAAQIIVFRVLLGVAISMCLPTSVSLITNTFPRGSWRNAAFAVNGMGHPLGYALGLVLGGIFTDTIGWRWAYYMMAIINACISVASVWALPVVSVATERSRRTRLVHDIDWFGVLIISAALGMLLYVLAMTSSSYKRLDDPQNLALLVISVALLAAFPFWMNYQTKRERPALIPNKVWRNWAFTSICIAVFLCWASLNGIEYFTTLYFQDVEGLSAMDSSIRFIPHVITGASVNIITGFLISRVKVRTLSVVSALITMIAAPLMATVDVGENYWYRPFWALFLSPVNPDVLFTASNLVISEAFPPELQSLAGGVFNVVAQFGNSVGLAITAAIAASVTEQSGIRDTQNALMKGYRAAFWTIFASCSTVTIVLWFGLKKGGVVGKKNV